VPAEGIPERLGPYRLRDKLGEGGMGVVYLATDPALRLVAVKALRHGVAAEATSRRRLAREFEMMRRVHSPFVAEVMDANVEHDPPYIVTRYVPGRTVEDAVARDGPLTGLGLLRLARGLASALAAVHAAGIVHRDLKPGNVMLLSGDPVVIDFGIAQALDSSRLTSTGMVMGTPGYLAPEVIEGSSSGPAADVHSWAATLAYAATGRPPFGTGSYQPIFYRILNGQPDLATMPAPLLPLVLAALARDPARRPSAAELADRVAALDPATLVPDLAATVPPGMIPPSGLATVGDPRRSAGPRTATAPVGMMIGGARQAGRAVPPAGAARAGAVGAGAVGAGAGRAGPGRAGAGPGQAGTAGAGTAAPSSYADLLPPVRYGPDGGPAAPAAAGAASRPRSPRTPLALAVMAILIAIAVLLPVGGTAVALAALVLLRSADLTMFWLWQRRSRPGVAAGALAGAAFAPAAVLRSLLNLVLKVPLALLFAAVGAAAALLWAPSDPIRAAGYASGAFVFCYALGPGSVRCRRPLSRLFGAVTTSTLTTAMVFIGVLALAAGLVAAAISLPPDVWPTVNVSAQFARLSWVHDLTTLPGEVTRWRQNLGPVSRWLG
jgi:hypothetical protein